MTYGFILSPTGIIKYSWRWPDDTMLSPMGCFVEAGDSVVYLAQCFEPDEPSDALLFEVHTSVHLGWTWEEVAEMIAIDPATATRLAIPDLSKLGDGPHVLITGDRAIDARPDLTTHPELTLAELLALRRQEQEAAQTKEKIRETHRPAAARALAAPPPPPRILLPGSRFIPVTGTAAMTLRPVTLQGRGTVT